MQVVKLREQLQKLVDQLNAIDDNAEIKIVDEIGYIPSPDWYQDLPFYLANEGGWQLIIDI